MAFGNTLKEFGVKIGLQFDKKKAKEAKDDIKELGTTLKEVGLHVAEATAALIEMANIFSEHSRSVEENSAQLGINVEKLQELQYAAKVAANVSNEELGGALEGISHTLFEARSGNVEAANAFIRLGVSIDDLRNPAITSDKLLAILADRFQKLPNGIYKTALAMQAGGGSLVKLLPLLSKGSAGMAAMGKEARSLGLVMDEAVIKRGAEFDRQLSKIWLVIKNISYTIGSEVAKNLFPIVNDFLRWVSVNRQFIAQNIAGAFKAIGFYLNLIYRITTPLIHGIQAVVNALGGMEKVAIGIGIAFGLFESYRLITGIIKAAQALKFLGYALTTIDLPVAALAAGLIALILIIQDLFSEDSIIKEWFAKFKKEFPNLGGFATDFIDVMVKGAHMIAEGWSNIWSWIKAVFDMISGNAIIKTMEDVIHKIDTMVGYLRSGNLGGKLFDAVDSAKDFLGFGGSTATASNSTGDNSTQNNMTANVTVMVPPGMGPKQATEVVSQGVNDGFSSMVRHTRNANIGGVAY